MLENKDDQYADLLTQQGLTATMKALENRDKAAHQMFLESLSMQRLQAQMQHWQQQATGAGGKLTGPQYKNLYALRAQGQTTGVPEIDALDPATAKKLAGLEPKMTAAQNKARDQLIGTNNVLNEIQALIPEMDAKGFLAQSSGKIAQERAAFNRWRNAADPTLAKWKSLQGSIVGFDRAVFNDIGARIRSAFEGSLELFDKPYTAEGLRDAIAGYQRILRDSPEAKRVLSENPEAMPQGITPPSSGGSPAPRQATPSNMMHLQNKQTGEEVYYPIGPTPDGWRRLQ